jgi:DNA helicase-2/ATP-dependent DNA helicase PcrA
LALTALQKANQLGGFLVRPMVLDEWEVKEIFDAELCAATGYGNERAQEIRREHEAFWVTGQWNPANYVQPKQPITLVERQVFNGFHQVTTQAYACVLPGAIIRRCVQQINGHQLDPVQELDLRHLIVDEYQDLNPLDIEFIDTIANAGATVFVAGDDDQSIYSFRFASPGGIQDFTVRHPGAGDHVLEACFRSAQRIVDGANALITHYSSASRIPKTLSSLWAGAAPPVPGAVFRWRFKTDKREAEAVAQSAAALIGAGVPANEIMLLLSTTRLFAIFRKALESAHVPLVAPRENSWVDSEGGRLLLGILRIVTSSERDYVAYRLVLGCRQNVGPRTCHQIVDLSAQNNANYHDLFHLPLPGGVFNARQTTALDYARTVCQAIGGWTAKDELALRRDALRALIGSARPASDVAEWDALVATLPGDTTLEELQDYLWADNPDQRRAILVSVHARLGIDPPPQVVEAGVRVLTMHGAKGLQAKVVFIPALEEYLLPGPGRLADEGARLLYVSITRARAAVVLSYATGRYYGGHWCGPQASQYCAHLDGAFGTRDGELTARDVQLILGAIADMN